MLPASKKQKKSNAKRVVLVDDFHLDQTHLKQIIKNAKCNIVPLTSDGSPVLVQLSGGGVIPLSFGIDEKDFGGNRKVTVSLQIDSDSDHENLSRLRDELIKVASTTWKSWYPEGDEIPSLEMLTTLCHGLVSERKKKQNGEDFWSGISKAGIETAECSTGVCKIVNRDTAEIVSFENLPGMLWHKVIFELRYIYIQSKQTFGITKKLRYLSCSEGEERGEVLPI